MLVKFQSLSDLLSFPQKIFPHHKQPPSFVGTDQKPFPSPLQSQKFYLPQNAFEIPFATNDLWQLNSPELHINHGHFPQIHEEYPFHHTPQSLFSPNLGFVNFLRLTQKIPEPQHSPKIHEMDSLIYPKAEGFPMNYARHKSKQWPRRGGK